MTTPVRKKSKMKEIDYETRYPTKKELTKAYAEWFESKREDWTLFTVTVVFKPTDLNNGKERWEDEYTKRVLGKIRKAIEPKTANQTEALPFPNFFYFERNEASTFRLTKSRKPFHIHALLPIRNYQVGRMWSIDDGNVKEQLQKDFHSIDTVQSILIEPVPLGTSVDWVRYITKSKSV
jgi:hypothetical protein